MFVPPLSRPEGWWGSLCPKTILTSPLPGGFIPPLTPLPSCKKEVRNAWGLAPSATTVPRHTAGGFGEEEHFVMRWAAWPCGNDPGQELVVEQGGRTPSGGSGCCGMLGTPGRCPQGCTAAGWRPWCNSGGQALPPSPPWLCMTGSLEVKMDAQHPSPCQCLQGWMGTGLGGGDRDGPTA